MTAYIAPGNARSGASILFALGADLEWQDQALCAETDPGAFFPDRGDRHMVQRAKAICQHCPVITECREYAIGAGEEWGVWGGLSERERRKLIRTTATVTTLATVGLCGRGLHVLPATDGPRRRCMACRREADRVRKAERKAREGTAQTSTEAA